MQKSIQEMQDEAEKTFEKLKNSQMSVIKKRLTKKKIFEFQIMNMGIPILRILVNGRFYKQFMKFGKNWEEF
jgi:hypothetical protein